MNFWKKMEQNQLTNQQEIVPHNEKPKKQIQKIQLQKPIPVIFPHKQSTHIQQSIEKENKKQNETSSNIKQEFFQPYQNENEFKETQPLLLNSSEKKNSFCSCCILL